MSSLWDRSSPSPCCPVPVSPPLALPTEDAVYLKEEDERREYVLSQQGLIYMGSRDYITSTPWNFGQVSTARPWDPQHGQHHTANKRKPHC